MAGRNWAHVILKNAAANYFRHIVMICTFIFLMRFVKDSLGKELFGLWALLQAVVAFFRLADLGFGVSVVKFVADARGRDETERLRDVTATLFWVYMALGGAVLLIALSMSPFISGLLDLPRKYAHLATTTFLLLAFRWALEMPLDMYRRVMGGYQLMRWGSLIRSFSTILYALFTWRVLKASPCITSLAWVVFCTYTFTDALTMIVALIFLKGISLSPRHAHWSLVREMWGFARYLFVCQIAMMLAMRVDALITNWWFGLTAVGFYMVASRTAEQASGFCGQFASAISPVYAELKGAEDEERIRMALRRGATLAVGLATPLLMGLCWFARPVMDAWMGPDYAMQSTVPMQILLCTAMLGIMNANFSNVLTMTGYQRFLAKVVIISEVMNLCLTLLFVTCTDMGLPGVALATLISFLICGLGVMGYKAGKLYHFSALDYLQAVVRPALIGAIFMFGALWLADLYFPAAWLPSGLVPTGLLSKNMMAKVPLLDVAVLESLGCVVFGLAFLFLGLGREERRYYVGRVLDLVLRRRSRRIEPEEESSEA